MANTFFNKLVSVPVQPTVNSGEEDKLIKNINDKLDSFQKTLESDDIFKDFQNIITTGINNQLQKIKQIKTATQKTIDYNKKKINLLYKNYKSKISKVFSTDYSKNECLKKIPLTFENFINKIESGISIITKKILSIIKSSFQIIKTVGVFLFDVVKKGLGIIDKLLFGIPSKVWNIIKNTFDIGLKVFNWVTSVGKIAIEYIWEGVSVIFKTSMKIISSAASYLYKGVKGFFSWWFKMMFNTLLNPMMWPISIPLFTLISLASFTAFGLVLAASASVLLPIFEASFDILKIVGSWIGDAIYEVFKWLKYTYQDSWLEKVIVNPFINFIKENTPEFIKNIYNTALEWGGMIYDWLSKNGSSVLNYVQNKIEEIQKFYKETPGETLFQKFINTLFSASWFPAGAKTFIQRRIGARIGTDVSGNIPFYNTVQNALLVQQSRLLTHRIELEFINLKKEGLDEESILKNLNEIVIPQTVKTLSTDIDSKEIQRAKEIGIDHAKRALSGKLGLYDITFLQQEAQGIVRLQLLKKFIESPQYNALDPNLFKVVTEDLNEIGRQTSDSIVEKARKTITTKSLKDLKDNLNIIPNLFKQGKEKLDTSSILSLTSTVRTLKEISDVNVVHRFGMPLVESFFGIFGGKIARSKTEAGSISLEQYQNSKIYMPIIKKEAKGDIVLPNKTDLTKTIPLNSIGAEYVRSRIKDIKADYSKIDTNKEKNNITIIEEEAVYQDSYEIYTMDKIAKGILKV